MKQISTLTIALVISIASFAQQAKILGQVVYNTDGTITAKYFLMNLTGSSTNCQVSGIKVGMHYNPAVLTLVSDSIMSAAETSNGLNAVAVSTTTGLNASDYSNTFGNDLNETKASICTNVSTGENKTFTEKTYTRSTNTFSNTFPDLLTL